MRNTQMICFREPCFNRLLVAIVLTTPKKPHFSIATPQHFVEYTVTGQILATTKRPGEVIAYLMG